MTTTSTPPLSRPDRALIAEVSKWARRHGWMVGPHYDGEPRRVRSTSPRATSVTFGRRGPGWYAVMVVGETSPHYRSRIADVRVSSVRQAVDLLVALEILPAQFSSLRFERVEV